MIKLELNIKMKKIIILIFLSFDLNAQNAYEIIEKSQNYTIGNSQKVDISITINRPKWERKMSLKAWSLGTNYSLILITAPSRDRGTVFLKKENEIWNWQPKIERIIKLPPSMMMQSWMGSDFTNDDLIRESSILDDYSHFLLGDTLIDNSSCFKIKLIPKDDAPVVWGKIITFIDKSFYFQRRSEFYDEEGELINIMKLSEIKLFNNKKLPSKITVIPIYENPDSKTTLIYNNIDFNININSDFFSKQNMKRIK